MNKNFDYQAAKDSGYSDSEIEEYLSKQPKYETLNKDDSAFTKIKKNFSNFIGNFGNPTGREEKQTSNEPQVNQKLLKKVPNFDVQSALDSGYSADEINDYLEENQPKRSALEKGGRLASQYAIGGAENALLPYELAVQPLTSKEAQQVPYRENLGEDIENLMIQKESGIWNEQDEEFLQNLQSQMQDPSKSDEFIQTADLGVRGLAEKTTGLDLHPEDFSEKAAGWTGFIKNPKNIADLAKRGIDSKALFKAILPTGTEAARGLSAGAALQMAESGEFGPIGTMGAVIAADVLGGLGAEGVKGITNLISRPREALAEAAASFTSKDKRELQKQIIKDFRDSGIQADIGTLTDNNLVKFTQSRLAQSGLTGKALDELREQTTNQIKSEYKALAESLGEAKYATTHEAGEVLKEGVKSIRDADLAATRQLYQNAEKALKEKAYVPSQRLASAIDKLEKKLTPGALKSTEQQSVLRSLETLKKDLYDSNGGLMYANVKELMNNKIALSDIINYEVQGGSKQLLKEIVGEIDRAIISHGKENPSFAKNFVNANKKFSEHAKTFRNKTVDQLLKTPDPAQLLNKMNSIHGIRSIEKILSRSPQGKEIFNGLKRMKLEKSIGDNLVDSTSQQVKLGTFSKLLEKGKNKELFKEILGKDAFRRLEKLQKNSGKLAETAQKFFNSSKTGSTLEDVALISKTFTDLANIFAGNPWPLLRTAGSITGARYLTRLIADPNFLKLVEEAILAGEKNDTNLLLRIGERLVDPIRASLSQERVVNNGSAAQSEKNM